jgi:hypothetical protein
MDFASVSEQLLRGAALVSPEKSALQIAVTVLCVGTAAGLVLLARGAPRQATWSYWFILGCIASALQVCWSVLDGQLPEGFRWRGILVAVFPLWSGVNNAFYFLAGAELLHRRFIKQSNTQVFGVTAFLVLGALGALGPSARVFDTVGSVLVLLLYTGIYLGERGNNGARLLLGACAIGTALQIAPQIGFGVLPALSAEIAASLGPAALGDLWRELGVHDVATSTDPDHTVRVVLGLPVEAAQLVFSVPFMFGALLRLSQSIRQGQQLLDAVRVGQASVNRGNALSQGAVAQAVQGVVEADRIVILVSKPGADATSVASYVWPAESSSDLAPRIDAEVVTELDRAAPAGAARSFVTVPILVNGAPVACLHAEWRRSFGWSRSTLARIQDWAAQLAPLVQSSREFHALERLVFEAPVHERSAGAAEPVKAAVAGISRLVNDTLGALATTTRLSCGFAAVAATEVALDPPADQGRTEALDTELHAIGVEGSLGTITMTSRSGADPLTRPFLGRNPAVRHAAAALVASALFDAHRFAFVEIVKDARARISLEPEPSVDLWYSAIAEIASRVGLAWVVADVPGEGPLRGAAESIALVNARGKAPGTILQGWTLIPSDEAPPVGCLILAMRLGDSGGHLWLGIRNTMFGRELTAPTPWLELLKWLESLASEILTHILDQREIHRTQKILNEALLSEVLGSGPQMAAHDIAHMVSPLAGMVDAIEILVRRGASPTELGVALRTLRLEL